MTGGATIRAVRGGISRRRLQTTVIALVVLVSTASTVLALALVVDSNAPFDHAFARQRGADIVATIDPAVSASSLARTAHLRGVSAVAGPYGEATVTARSAGMTLPPQTLVGRAAPGGPVDDLVVEDGRWATKPGEVVLATGGDLGGLGFSVGSTLTVGTGSHRQTLTVVGLANSVTGSASGWVVPAELPALRAAGGTAAVQMLYRFADAGTNTALHADAAAVTAALPRGAVAGTMSYYTAKVRENGNIAPFVPFLLAFGVLGIVMSVLIVANVVGGAVVSGYRRIGILKSLGFTPAQVALAYAAQVALPALVGCVIGVGAGNLLAAPLLRQNADVYGVGRLGVPIWVDVAVPAGICLLAALAALLPALRAGRLSTVQAIAIGRAPKSGRGYGAHRLLGRVPLPRAITIGLAAPFARPARTLLTLAAVLLGATAVTFAVGLTSSLKHVVNGLSHREAEPVQIALPGSGGTAGPKRVKIGTPVARPGGRTSPAAAEHAILAAVRGQSATVHVVAEADDSVDVAGLSQQVQVAAFRGPAAWTGYDLVSGHWYTGPEQVVVPTGFLTQTGRSVGDTIAIGQGRNRLRVRIVGEVFDTHDRGLNIVTSWATLRAIDPGLDTRPVRRGPAPGDVGHRLRECDQPQARPQLSRRAERPWPRRRRRDDRSDRHALAAPRCGRRARRPEHGRPQHARARARPRRLQGGRDDTPPDDRDGHLVGCRHRPRGGRDRRPAGDRAPSRDPPGDGLERRVAPAGELPRRLRRSGTRRARARRHADRRGGSPGAGRLGRQDQNRHRASRRVMRGRAICDATRSNPMVEPVRMRGLAREPSHASNLLHHAKSTTRFVS